MTTPTFPSQLPLIVPTSPPGSRELRAPAGFAETLRQVEGTRQDTTDKQTPAPIPKPAAPDDDTRPDVANGQEDQRGEVPSDDSAATSHESPDASAEATDVPTDGDVVDTVEISAAAVTTQPLAAQEESLLEGAANTDEAVKNELVGSGTSNSAGGGDSNSAQLEAEVSTPVVVAEEAVDSSSTTANSKANSNGTEGQEADVPTSDRTNPPVEAVESVAPAPSEASLVAGVVTTAHQRDSSREAAPGDTATVPVAQAHGESDAADNSQGGATAAKRTADEVGTQTGNVGPETGDATPEVDLQPEADTGRGELREKPSPASQNFHTLLERSTASAARREEQADPSQNAATRVDTARFVTRVARAFEAAEQRGGTIQLRLSPPELGAMKIELSMQQGGLTARLEAETTAAKNVLLDNLPALRERLAAQDIRIEKFEVDVRQQGSESQPDWQAQQESRDAEHRPWQRRGRTSQLLGGAAAEPTARQTRVETDHDGKFSAVA